MKKLLSILLVIGAAAPAGAQTRLAANTVKPAPVTQAAPQIQVPAPEAQVILIRSALVALSQANQTNNYSVLNALGSPSFQSGNPPARLAQSFASFRSNQIDLAPVAWVMPRFTSTPQVQNGKLRLVGFFPTAPMQVNFDLTYEPAGGNWRLFGLAVNLNRSASPGQ